ncbi:MAG TPA: hypothetical protein VLC79_14270 [Cellvibrio sp.]|nr:hypothetical protein [Cellvibrio sp.]
MLASSHITTDIEPSHQFGLIPKRIRHQASHILLRVAHRPGLLRAVAMAFTLVLHLLALWLGLFKPSAPEAFSPRLHYIHLNPVVESQDERYEKPVIQAPPIQQEKINSASIPALQMIDLQVSSHSSFESLTPEDLKVISDRIKRPAVAIGENVFHPGLRQQLEDEAHKPVFARVEDHGLETYIDPSGATIVVSGNGSCMRSPAAKIGEPRNWYSVACAGKNESEKIMDRVNEAVNGKLKLE